MFLWIGLCLLPLCALLAGRSLPGRGLRRGMAWAVPLTWVAFACYEGREWEPWQRLVAATVGLLWSLKATVLLHFPRAEIRNSSRVGLALYTTLWPGMDPAPFRVRQTAACPGAARLALSGLPGLLSGLALIAALSDFAPRLGDLVLGWGGIGVFLLTVHFGYAHVLPGVLQIGGWPVRKLFERPFSSRSLTDFWSRRWNLAFVEMSRLLFLKPLRRWFGAAGAVCGVFLISGLLHEFALSYPAAGGWGGPLAYFLLQGGLVLTERRWLHPERWPAWAGRLWAAAWLLAPLPWLFHAPFRDELIVPLFRYLQKWEVS